MSNYSSNGRYLFKDYYTNSYVGSFYMGSGEGVWQSSLVHMFLANAGVHAEKSSKYNVGIDAELFGKLHLSADAFIDKRTDILTLDNSMMGYYGKNYYFDNIGKMTNKGVELSAVWNDQRANWGYSINGSVSFNRNKIDYMAEVAPAYSYNAQTGRPYGTLIGLVADGFYDVDDFNADGSLREGLPVSSYQNTVRPGDVKYRDLNRDGRIDDYDRTYQLYAAVPEIYYGFSVELKYRGFGVSAYFQGVAHSTLETTLSSIYQPLYGNDRNVSEYYMEHRWSRFNTEGRYPRLTTLANGNNYTQSSLWTENGNFLKLRTLQAYYKLPSKIARKLRMRECSFYFRGLNLFSADHVGILDPEYVSTGYPSSRSYQIGLNVIF